MSRIAYLVGDIDVELKVFLESVPDSSSKAFHNSFLEGLSNFGFSTKSEVFVSDRGDGRRGKIDIEAIRGNEILAIELDRENPRRKSIIKIHNHPSATARIVICRI